MKKSGWERTSLCVCGSTPKPCCAMGADETRLWTWTVTWVTEGALWEHEWITDTNVTLKENEMLEALDYEIDVLCPLQCGLLRFSAPTDLNRRFVNSGTKVAEFTSQPCDRINV